MCKKSDSCLSRLFGMLHEKHSDRKPLESHVIQCENGQRLGTQQVLINEWILHKTIIRMITVLGLNRMEIRVYFSCRTQAAMITHHKESSLFEVTGDETPNEKWRCVWCWMYGGAKFRGSPIPDKFPFQLSTLKKHQYSPYVVSPLGIFSRLHNKSPVSLQIHHVRL